MPYYNASKNAMLDHLGTQITHVSLHTADPTDAGDNEVTGGEYSRESVSWGSAAAGEMAASNEPVFDVPGSTTITHVGFWSAGAGGTIFASAPITDETFASDGTYTLTSILLDLNAT